MDDATQGKKRVLEAEERKGNTKKNDKNKRAKHSLEKEKEKDKELTTADAQEEKGEKAAEREPLAFNTEEQVGITAFLNDDRQGWTALFKQRYTDFIVNEVALDATVVHLTDTQ